MTEFKTVTRPEMALAWRIRQQISIDNPYFQALNAVFLGAILGIASLYISPVWVLATLFGLGGAIIVLKKPVFLLLGVLVLSSTILAENQVPTVPAGPMRLYLSDIFLLMLGGIIILRWIVEPEFRLVPSPLNVPLMLFLGIALLSTTINLMFSSLNISMAISEMRIILYYGTFFIVVNIVQRDEKLLRLLITGLIVLGGFVTLAMVSQFALGQSGRILSGRVESLITEGMVRGEVTRIVTSGESLVLTGFITMITVNAIARTSVGTVIRGVFCGLLGLGVLLTFNRNFWIAIGLAFFLLALLLRGHERNRFWGLLFTAVLVIIIVMLLIFAFPGSTVETLAQSSIERVASLFDSETYSAQSDTSTLRWRDFEYYYAIPQIAANPILGMGVGAEYRPLIPGIDHKRFDGRHFVHNAHIWIMVKTGLLGYAAFAWLSGAFLIRGLKNWRRIASHWQRGILLGFWLTYVGVIFGSIVNPMFMQWYWTPVIGIMMGVNEVIIRISSMSNTSIQTTENI